MKNGRSILVFVILCSVWKAGAGSSVSCRSLMVSGPNRSYLELSQTPFNPEAHSQAIHLLLRDFFLPPVQKFSESIHKRIVDSSLKFWIHKMETLRVFRGNFEFTSVHRGLYEFPVAKIAPAGASDNGTYWETYEQLKELMLHNAANGVQNYQMTGYGLTFASEIALEKQDRVFRSVPHFVFVDPSEEFMKPRGGVFMQLGTLMTPIGDYGPQFAERLLRTTFVMWELAQHELSQDLFDQFKTHSLLLMDSTARSKNSSQEGAIQEEGPMRTLLEGLVSLHQLLSALTSERIQGADSGEEALQQLIFQSASRLGVLSEATAQIPMGLIGPMTTTGTQFQKSLRRNQDGRLELTDLLRAQFQSQKNERRKLNKGLCPMASLATQRPSNSGDTVCKSGLQILAESYWLVFQQINENP